MRKLARLTVVLTLGAFCLSADSSLGPVLQWVKTIGGSGNSQITAAAADAKGNLYIAGSTSSVDFPMIFAIQRNAGGSTRVRINAATSAAQKLYPAGLSTVTSCADSSTRSSIGESFPTLSHWLQASPSKSPRPSSGTRGISGRCPGSKWSTNKRHEQEVGFRWKCPGR